jgi:hypothetical protein
MIVRIAAAIVLLLGVHCAVCAHDAIGADARKAYLAKLDELHRVTQSGAAATARATAWLETGRLLDEIRGLLNEDIISHGKTQGLETSVLINQLNSSVHKLQLSAQTRLYLSDLAPYREALKLDPNGRQAPLARYLLLKNHFYDSFADNPLKPFNQSSEQLQQQIALGESLLALRDPAIDSEEVHFILAMHYLQALASNALPKAKAQSRIAALQKTFRARWPESLRLATIDALAAP